jgi:hypothetical protein
VADADMSAIDRFFDRVDNVIDTADRGLDSIKRLHKTKPEAAKADVRVDEISNSTAVAIRRYRIQEVTDAQSGAVIWIVTDGTSRAECNTRELAEKLVRMLEAAP